MEQKIAKDAKGHDLIGSLRATFHVPDVPREQLFALFAIFCSS